MEHENRCVQWLIEEKYKGRMTAGAKKDIARLESGEPLDYVIGFVDFLGCKIDLSKKPLIPRFETEFWTEKAIEEISDKSNNNQNFSTRILDIFAGSGCIGIAAAKHVKNSHIVFAESDKKTIEQIKINTRTNHISKSRHKIIQSDIFSDVAGKFDYILANPPYIPAKNKHKVRQSVLRHEPWAALFGGGDGLFYIRKFLAEAKNFLYPGGKIYMEFDSIQKEKIEKLLKKNDYKSYEFHRDQYGKWRYVVSNHLKIMPK